MTPKLLILAVATLAGLAGVAGAHVATVADPHPHTWLRIPVGPSAVDVPLAGIHGLAFCDARFFLLECHTAGLSATFDVGDMNKAAQDDFAYGLCEVHPSSNSNTHHFRPGSYSFRCGV